MPTAPAAAAGESEPGQLPGGGKRDEEYMGVHEN